MSDQKYEVQKIRGRWRLSEDGKIARTKTGKPIDGGFKNCKAGAAAKHKRERQQRYIEEDE